MSLPQHQPNGEWTAWGLVELPWPWPPTRSIQLYKGIVPSGILTLTVHPSSTITAHTVDGTNVLEILSCRLTQPQHTATAFFIVKNDTKLELFLNITLVASNVRDTCEVYEFCPPALSPSLYDFTKENIEARKRRFDTVVGTHPKKGRERATREEIFAALKSEILQISDLLDRISKGHLYHAVGLAARVRVLIADNRHMALLQWCAAMIDVPLIIYTAAQPRHFALPKAVGNPISRLLFTGSANPRLLTRNPVDLDVWLSLPSAHVGDQRLTNKEALHKIASSIGSHFDVDRHPLIDVLRQSHSDMTASGESRDWLVDYICEAAHLSVCLASKVLKKAKI